MLSAMSLNMCRYNARSKAAPSLIPRDNSSTLDYMTDHGSSPARPPKGLAGPWPPAGEDPSVSAACPAVTDARWDGVTLRVSLNNMDPARFPAGCNATEVKVGGIDVRGIALAAVPSVGCLPIVPTTSYVFQKAGVVTPGTKVELRIQCIDAAGLRHQTQYAGTF
jgi:hypothetical protein